MAAGDPLICNAVASVLRNNVYVANMTSMNIFIKELSPQNMSMDGVPVSFDILGGPGNPGAPTIWHQNDILRLESDPYAQVQDYTVLAIIGPPRGLRPLWHVRIRGVIR